METKELLKRANGGILRGAQANLARKLGIGESSVSRWLDGKAKPSEQYVLAISRLVGCSPADVLSAFGIKEKSDEFAPLSSVQGAPLTPNNTVTLPILADVPAGMPEYSDRDVEQFVDFPRFLFPGADYVIRCIGDSLEPNIRKGDYCVIRKMKEPLDGRPMFVRTENGVCMKIVKKTKDGVRLVSLNPKYKPFVPSELEIFGLIIGYWSRTDREVWG